MSHASLSSVVQYCDRTLRTDAIGDYDGAVNGLQVANSGKVTRIAATVDASLATVKLAIGCRRRNSSRRNCRRGGSAGGASRAVLEFAPAVDGE